MAGAPNSHHHRLPPFVAFLEDAVFGTRGPQIQILPLRPMLALSRSGYPDSFPDMIGTTATVACPCAVALHARVELKAPQRICFGSSRPAPKPLRPSDARENLP